MRPRSAITTWRRELPTCVDGGERIVNTIHQQAIDRLADGFQVSASAHDGVIEAIESDDPWPFLGVQWHPEKVLHGADAPLFAWLCDAAASARRVPIIG